MTPATSPSKTTTTKSKAAPRRSATVPAASSRSVPLQDSASIAHALWPEGRSSIRLDEFAELLRCTTRHLQNLIDRGQLVSIETARPARRNFRVARQSFETFITARTEPNSTPSRKGASR